jgi:serpin B
VCGAMLETLSLDSENSVLAFADSVWMADRDGMTFRDAYLKTLSDVYRSEANAVRFGTKEAAEQIADWIREHTRGKIDVSPEALPFSADTVAVLINAVYLKVAWSDAFYEGATASGAFDGPDGRLTVDYMHRRADNSSIVQGDGFLRYSLPLCQFGRMTFVLPDEGVSLSDLLGSPEKLHALLCGGESIEAHVDVKLPKFAFQDQIDLSDALIALGAGRAFSSEADFSGMFADRCSIAISDVLQGSYIGVDEKGVEAAAYTLVAMDELMEMPRELPEIDFHLTRPFLYVIESRDGTVLFIGTVTSPSPAKG